MRYQIALLKLKYKTKISNKSIIIDIRNNILTD